jgi:CubicO group peptidase (beta-lactamase class C family)
MRKIFILFGFIFSVSMLSAQSVDKHFINIMNMHKLMGMSVLAVCSDSVVYSGSFGTADYAREIPVTDSTMYKVASISKTVTATALMVLYEQKLFKLDDDIGSILGYKIRNPHYPDVVITPRMLLSHTSSLQDGTGYWNFLTDTYKKDTVPSFAQLLTDTGSYYTKDIWQEKKPGTYFSYCNMNYGIIGSLIEKLSGQRFDIFCKQNIFDPLGIKGSYRVQDIDNINNVAAIYRMYNGLWYPQTDNFKGIKPKPRDLSNYVIGSNGALFAPQSALRISARDLSKLMLMQMNGGEYKGIRILKDATVKLMHRPQWTYNGKNGDTFFGLFLCWGLGFQVTTDIANGDIIAPGYTMTGHIGDAYGLLSDFFYNQEKHFGMIFITNGSANEFENGHGSAFNAVEEDALSALYNLEILPRMQNRAVSDIISNDKMETSADNLDYHTNVRFYLSAPGNVYCSIYNDKGKLVSQYHKYFDSYGRKQLSLDTKNLTNGLYYCLFQSLDDKEVMIINLQR